MFCRIYGFYIDKREPEVIGFKFEAKDFYFEKALFNLVIGLKVYLFKKSLYLYPGLSHLKVEKSIQLG